MAKIKKIKEIPSKIKIIEPSEKKSELEEEIREEDLENFAEFMQSSASTSEEITPVLSQSNLRQQIEAAAQTAEESRTEDISPTSEALYESMSRSTYISSESSAKYDPSLRKEETTASTIMPSKIFERPLVQPRFAEEGEGLAGRAIEPTARERQYERAEEGGGRRRRGRAEEGG